MAYQRSEHEKKYDRQMRLWGSHGQLNLEKSHVCCIGSGAAAAETLKNLVLPNVGRFTIVDDAIATMADKNNNFFVDLHSVGRPRAEVVTELLAEMNPDVKGVAKVQDPASLLDDLSFFSDFSLVIISAPSIPISRVLNLARYLWDRCIPLISIQLNGLLSVVRLQLKEECIVESHPAADRMDIYIHPLQTKRWRELQEYCEQFQVYASKTQDGSVHQQVAPVPSTAELQQSSSSPANNPPTSSSNTLDTEAHAHIPYIAILYHCLRRWRMEHPESSQDWPTTYDEKQQFKEAIRKAKWNAEETNFDEAIDFAHRAYELPKLDSSAASVLSDPSTRDPKALRDNKFWLLARACSEFLEREGGGVCLPVSTALPDMHCRTADYVRLKQLFAARAQQDRQAVRAHVERLCIELGLPSNHVSDAELDGFVQNVRTVKVVRTSSLESEYGRDGTSAPTPDAVCNIGAKRDASAAALDGEDEKQPLKCNFPTAYMRELLEEAMEEEEAEAEVDDEMSDSDGAGNNARKRPPHNILWYLAFRAAAIFRQNHGRAPGDVAALVPDEDPAAAAASSATLTKLEEDVHALMAIEKALIAQIGLDHLIPEPDLAVAIEVVRSGGCEPHVTAAFVGGIAAQIGLKVLLRQYVPANNTFIWNGVFTKATTLQM